MSAAVAMMTTERERSEEPHVLPLALTLAFSGHLVLAVLSPPGTPAPTTVLPPLEVELASKPAPPPPPPAPAPEPAAPEPAHAAARTPHPGARAATPAAAGKLIAVQGPTSDSDAPLDFVNDPNGGAYGFGVVSRGGTAAGEGRAPVPEPPGLRAAPPRALPSPALAVDLSEKPRLQAEDPCRGYYPASAVVDSASAVVRVVVEANGTAREVTIVSESPAGEGFGAAARQCLRQQRFSAARDREGRSVATATTIRVRFER